MCILTNSQHIVLDNHFLPGIIDWESNGYHLYYPEEGEIKPDVGNYYNPKQLP